MSHRHVTADRSARARLATVAALFAIALLAAHDALAARLHCRDLVFDGAAGASSQDLVTIRVVDTAGNTLDDSCTIQVKNNETHTEFVRRLPGVWRAFDGSCPGDDTSKIGRAHV